MERFRLGSCSQRWSGRMLRHAVFLWAVWSANSALARVVRYDLTATQRPLNLSGFATVDWAIQVNGTIPAPTLEFTEGDDAEIHLHNHLSEEVSIHWHGILLPPAMDGVPYVNTPPVGPGATFVYRFKLRQHGTYWYHSHTMLQEQQGVYGALIVHPRQRVATPPVDVVVVLSDWSDEHPDVIQRHLHRDGDYYQYKKGTVRSWLGAWRAGALGAYFDGEWSRMGGMDLSDVGYDAFLVNGKRTLNLAQGLPPGTPLRLRIINAASSTYFYLTMGKSPMAVVAADGVDVVPIRAERILIGMAETYDVLFTLPKGERTELRASAQDGTGGASVWLGAGHPVPAEALPPPDLYASMAHSMAAGGHEHGPVPVDSSPAAPTDHADHLNHANHAHHADHAQHPRAEGGTSAARAVPLLTVADLNSPAAPNFAWRSPNREITMTLGGDMARQVWWINGATLREDPRFKVAAGEVVRITFINETMMHHPMHLHGHFFRVLGAASGAPPAKHTVDVPPHGRREVAFVADEPGDWMLHCHNLFHMKAGMGRILSYERAVPDPAAAALAAHDPHLHEHPYAKASLLAATQRTQLDWAVTRTRDAVEGRIEVADYSHPRRVEGDLLYRRWLTNYLSGLGGLTVDPEGSGPLGRGALGVAYVLPMLTEARLLVDHLGQPRLDLAKRVQWTSLLQSQLELRWRPGARVDPCATLMVATQPDWGAGLVLARGGLGLGVTLGF